MIGITYHADHATLPVATAKALLAFTLKDGGIGICLPGVAAATNSAFVIFGGSGLPKGTWDYANRMWARATVERAVKIASMDKTHVQLQYCDLLPEDVKFPPVTTRLQPPRHPTSFDMPRLDAYYFQAMALVQDACNPDKKATPVGLKLTSMGNASDLLPVQFECRPATVVINPQRS